MVNEMDNRKIGTTDWIHIRNWHIGCSLMAMGLSGVALTFASPLDWDGICFFGIPAIILWTFMFTRMARDKELNEKNGVKRFWLWF